ncbi:hypothetical protein CYJ46_05550 [Corynebacterium coyleae]|uniref:YPDG domain-containing protein n=2 Tax=Corynebacterium TaxID=1716 RepID=UPI000C763ACC|nr:YPDG domain-containing protein [Corynebacterium coyleae]PLA37990.1 hypothetical protein CYJ46_05550 [Corynebacterium coyleae]
MKKNYIARRRGTSVAAAALSFALVAPFAQPVAFAQETPPASESDQNANTPAPVVDENGIIEADAIASGRVTKAANLTDAHGVGKGLISGHVYLTGLNGNPSAAYDNGNVKLDGITVYAQFRDRDGSYSPIFKAQTHTLPDVVGGNGGQGTFAFGMGDKGITWTDKLGKEHTWAARADQQHRIWVEPFTNERGNRVEMFRQANGYVPGSFNHVAEAPLGSFVAADGNMQLMAAFLRELPPNHENSWMAAKGDKLVEDPKGPDAAAALQGPESNMLSGEVWLETGGFPDNTFPATGPKNESKDPAADGYTVFASTLTKDGAAANEALHGKFKADPDKLAEETKKMLEEHPEYILKTVYGKTDPEGKYSLRFGDYTDPSQTREDFLNPQHVFVWVENKKGEVQGGYTGFHTPVFQVFNGGGNFRPLSTPGEMQTRTALVSDIGNPRYGKPNNKLYNVNHAIMPYAPVSITADYNSTDKPAAPGVTVTPEFSGELSELPSRIEWRDSKGKVQRTCDIDQSKATKAQVADCTFDIPEEAKKGDVYNVVVVSGNNDVSAWSVLVTKDADEFTPSYEDKLVVPGEETKSAPTFTKVDEDGNETEEKVDAPEGSKFAIPQDFKAPEGYVVTIDENTGEITVTFPDKSKLNKDTVEEFNVPVVVTYPDGSTDDATAKFKLDTDGDGTPDSKDDDDDGDGVKDQDEIDNNTNPKQPPQADTYEPQYEGEAGKPGEDVKVEKPEFKDKDGNPTTAPDGTTFEKGEGAPDGVTVDENTGEITVTIPEDAKPGDKITVPVVVTYPDGTKDNVDVTVTVTDKDADVYEPSYEGKLVVPGKETKSSPNFTKSGKDATKPEDSKFAKGEGFTDPEGYEVKIDETSGEITVTFPDKSKLNADTVEEFDVPVTVTYKDGSTDEVKAKFKLDTDGDGDPDVTDPDDDGDGINDDEDSNPKVPNANDHFEPGYEDGSGKPGEDVKVEKPEFKDKDGNPTTAPDGTTFEKGEGAPDGVTVDEKTGEITVKVPEDATPGDKITVPVVVTYPDGSKDNVDVTVTVEEPNAPEQPDVKDNEKYDPEYKGGNGKPGTDVKVEKPEFKDKDGNPIEAPDAKFTPGENVPDGVTVDEKTGEITVKVPEDATPGDKITVSVVVTYPDETTDTVDVTVTVTDPEAKDNETFEPGYEDGSGKPGEDAKVPAPKFTDKDGNPTTAPDGTKFTPGENVPDGVTIDEKTGEITVTIPEDATPGTKITVPVVVTYPDETTDTVEVTVTVGEKDPDAPAPAPSVTETNTTVPNNGGEHTVGKVENPTGEETGKLVDKDGNEIPGSEVEIDKETGEIKVTVPEGTKPQDAKVIVSKGEGEDAEKIGEIDVKIVSPDYGEPTKVKAGETETSKNPFGENGKAPEGTDVTGTQSEGSEDWTFITDTDETPGVVTAKAPSYEKVGEKIAEKLPEIQKQKKGKRWDEFVKIFTPFAKPSVDVEFTYPGGSKDSATAGFDLVGKDGKSLLDPTGDFDGDGISNKDEIEGGTNPAKSDKGKTPEIDVPKCVATSVGFGLPLIALLPIGLATQIQIPGLSEFVAQANAQIQNANTQIQQQLGIFNPQLAAQVEAINGQLGQYGTDLATVAAGLALIAAGILAGTIIYDNCSPKGGSSVKDLELKGSSGNTYAGSSKETKAPEKK